MIDGKYDEFDDDEFDDEDLDDDEFDGEIDEALKMMLKNAMLNGNHLQLMNALLFGILEMVIRGK